MDSVKQLYRKCNRPNTSTIVLGNLGRYIGLIRFYFKDFRGVVWFEPAFGETIHKPPDTMIVFTSHLDLKWDSGIDIVVFHVGNAYKDWRLAYDKDLTRCRVVRPDYFHTFDMKFPPDAQNVVLDLTVGRFPYLRWLTFLDVWEHVPNLRFRAVWNGTELKRVRRCLLRSRDNLLGVSLAGSNVDCKTLFFRDARSSCNTPDGDRIGDERSENGFVDEKLIVQEPPVDGFPNRGVQFRVHQISGFELWIIAVNIIKRFMASPHRWIHFHIPSSTFQLQRNNLPYEMIVYRDDHNDLYFFGNTIAWCLGHVVPHEAIQQLLDYRYLHTLEWGSGQFLKEEGVRQLAGQSDIARAPSFLAWFDSYVRTCQHPGSKNDICPP
ncbi:hypothetical protein AVEN_261798-1 [Araneus ventricosus]|uniref:Uncharacterized protein n=1 Tax=Araneus ventricosus TaxID=182803 RepID=A0A4Y2LYZ5_ARAVE|nr:hypothetical protein AVEN_261798-1 [Araneus ventricosus]